MVKSLTKEKYIRQNGANLDNALDIASVRKQQQKDIVRNSRLGTYNAYGRYIIAPAVINELIGLKKYIYRESFDNVISEGKDSFEFRLTGYLPIFGAMDFRLVIKDKVARLYLLENVYREFNGYVETYGEQITDSFCNEDKSKLIDYLFTLYNVKVVDKEDLDGKKPEDLADDADKIRYIMFTKIYLTMITKEYLRLSAIDEKATFDDMVGILKEQGGEYGKKVLKHFIDRVEKRPDIMQVKDEDGYNESLNDILIGAIEVVTTEEDMKDPHIQEIYRRIYEMRFDKTNAHINEASQKVAQDQARALAEKILGGNLAYNPDFNIFEVNAEGTLVKSETAVADQAVLKALLKTTDKGATPNAEQAAQAAADKSLSGDAALAENANKTATLETNKSAKTDPVAATTEKKGPTVIKSPVSKTGAKNISATKPAKAKAKGYEADGMDHTDDEEHNYGQMSKNIYRTKNETVAKLGIVPGVLSSIQQNSVGELGEKPSLSIGPRPQVREANRTFTVEDLQAASEQNKSNLSSNKYFNPDERDSLEDIRYWRVSDPYSGFERAVEARVGERPSSMNKVSTAATFDKVGNGNTALVDEYTPTAKHEQPASEQASDHKPTTPTPIEQGGDGVGGRTL